MKKTIVWAVTIIFTFVSLSTVFAQQAADETRRSTPRLEKKAEPPASSEKKGSQKTKKKTKKVKTAKKTKKTKKNREKQRVKKASNQSVQKKNKKAAAHS